ncbi:DNA-binding transcriptional regulator, ArsR family [Friedmanniella luteola]|uniref:DNA-binding transcriptional regulator, ArsR family n=2 Tax=Friedmanniella luteola TaxID=546871 RepID=A0A1H2ABK0_9ACTN|nr:DNA-binding transcriptional regulator, ArsR family [Friedmanniella luteola]
MPIVQEMEDEAEAGLYRALADPTRRLLLDELRERDDQSLFELCTRLAVVHQVTSSRQAVSQHLAVLEAAGLVRTRRSGRTKLHTLSTAPLRAVLERWPLPTEETP